MEKVVVFQAETTSTGANTVGITKIRLQEVNHLLYRRESTGNGTVRRCRCRCLEESKKEL